MRQFGLALFILVLVQTAGGGLIHYLPTDHFVRWFHVLAGIIIAGGLYIQVRSARQSPSHAAGLHGIPLVQR